MTSLTVLAGVASTALFVASTLPMLVKAHRTHDLSSYSLGHLLLANAGNLVHSVYVYSLPPGPIWALHGFYLTSTAIMLVWFVRYGLHGSTHAVVSKMGKPTDARPRHRLLASIATNQAGGLS
jgi:hypothetical protein